MNVFIEITSVCFRRESTGRRRSTVLRCRAGMCGLCLWYVLSFFLLHCHQRLLRLVEYSDYDSKLRLLVCSALLPEGDSTCGQRAIYHSLGVSGIPIINVNNNCSTGSTALFMARQLVQGGMRPGTLS